MNTAAPTPTPMVEPLPEPQAPLGGPKRKAEPSAMGFFPMHILLILAILFVFHVARPFLLPVMLAFVLALVFRPLVRGLDRWHIPSALTALAVICGLAGGIVYGLSSLYQPAVEALNRAPEAVYRIEQKIRELRKPMEDAGRAAERVERITNPDRGRTVEIKQPSLGDRLLSGAPEFAASVLVIGFLLFFLLATGGRLISRIAMFTIARRPDSRHQVELLTALETQVSRYLGTITLINGTLGLVVATGVALLGMPNPVMWGVLVALLNYIPYIGGVVGVTLMTLAATLAFEEPWRMLAVPGVYVLCNVLEGMLITPTIVGRRFSLDPCFVFIWLVFWSWLWGVPGALLAVPLLAVVKISCDRVPAWAAFGRLISA